MAKKSSKKTEEEPEPKAAAEDALPEPQAEAADTVSVPGRPRIITKSDGTIIRHN